MAGEVVSKLAKGLIQSPHCSSRKGKAIKKITIHHMAGFMSAKQCAEFFLKKNASANYCVDESEIWCSCEERLRAWTSSNGDNDRQAITMELKNSKIGPNWEVDDRTIENCIKLCVDICQRYGIKELVYTGDKNGTLTEHRMFAATLCPGPYLHSKMSEIANEVNRRLAEYVEKPVEEEKNEVVHYVVKGETLSSIARRYGTTWAKLAEKNGIKNPNLIYVGQKIVIM